MPPLTQDQADQLYLEQRAAEMRDAAERRIVNWLQAIVIILGIVLAIRQLLRK